MKKSVLLTIFGFALLGALGQLFACTNTHRQSSASSATGIEQQLVAFYKSYATSIMNGDKQQYETLLKQSVTPDLRAKLSHMGAETGSDPLLRAQDFDSNSLPTIQVKALSDSWYMVSYRAYNNQQVSIPIKAITVKGKLLIEYVTPEWLGTAYGDRLLKEEQQSTSTISSLKSFYISYATGVATGTGKDRSLLEEHTTPELLDKISRIVAITGADPLLRAQDFDESLLSSIDVAPLSDNWYMVSYRVYNNQQVSIPIKATTVKGKLLIEYVTPEWNGEQYGDELQSATKQVQDISKSSPRSFIESFYKVYTQEYCTMPKDLDEQLEKLQAEYCSSAVQDKIKKAREDDSLYDLLIDNHDFDPLWGKSLSIRQESDTRFRVAYLPGVSTAVKLVVDVARDANGGFVISNVMHQ